MLQGLENTAGYHAWHGADPINNDWISYQAHLARADHAIYMAEFFWPTFEERDGLLLRRTPFSKDRVLDMSKYAGSSESQIEYMINHLHISDLFWGDPERARYDRSVYVYLARIMADMWRARLTAQFPNQQVVVDVVNLETDPEVYAQKLR